MSLFQSASKTVIWQYAIDRHLSCLSTAQRETFVAPAKPEDCLELIRQAQGRKKYDRLMVALRPLIEPLKRFEGSIDVLVQAQSGIASPIWGPLRIVVTLINDRLKTLQNLVVLLDRIVEPLKRFANYESLFLENELLQNAITALYCDLLEFCSRIIRYYSRSSFLNVFSSFDKDLLEVSDSIRHHWTEIDIVANAANIEEAKKAREAEKLQRQLDICKDINRWLSPSNVADDLRKNLSEYKEGSCNWLIIDSMFVRTLESPENSGLSIVARPGAGKTTAAAFTIRHLSGTQSGAVVYFFCKASDAEKRTSLHILRSLLWQCLQHDGDFYTDMVQWYYRSGRSVADSQTDVGAMFTACLQSKSLPAIYIVIDALDECLDTEDLLLALSNVMASSVRPLRLIIFSREGFDIPTLTSSQMRTIELTGEKCHAAIESYVSERLSAISTLRGLGQDNEIAQSIIDAADGLWLFARLLLDELQHAPSLGEVQRQICGLPHGLRSLYSSILRTKEKGFSDMQLRMAQELYLWIDETEYLPDWARWGGYNDILDGETICSLLNIVIGSKQLLHPPKLVKQLTSPLLEVRTISPASTFNADGVPYDCSDFDVDFFHQTVSQYLKWSVHAASTDLPQSLIPRRLGPLYRGVTAARYLSQSLEFKDNLQQLRERPRNGMFPNYLDMVYGLWGALKLSEMRWDLDGEEVIKAGYLCDQLTQFLSTDKCLGWIEAAVIINYARQCTKLIENVENVLEIDSDALSSTPAFHRFHCARQTFMGDYIYALASTWPKNDLPAETGARVGKTPYGFYQRPLARKIMALVRQYQWLLTPAQARSSNCFSFDCRS